VEMGALGRGGAAREGVRVVETKAVATALATAEATVAEARAAGMIAGVMEAAREGVTAAEATVVVVTAGRHTLRTLS